MSMWRTIIILGVLLVASVACGSTDAPATPSSSPSPAPMAAPSPMPPPSPTPAPTPDTRMAQYRERVIDISNRRANIMERSIILSQSVAVGDASWRSRFRDAHIELRLLSQEQQRLSPPPCYAAVHMAFSEAAGHYDRAAAAAIEAMNLLEAGRVTEAVPVMERMKPALEAGIAATNTATERIRQASC
jgi:hypothetical protein